MQPGGFSRTTLFLLEQLIAITVLALCSAVCIRLFAESYIAAVENAQVKSALIAVQSGAEVYKAFYGDAEGTALELGGRLSVGNDEITVYYDRDWQNCTEAEARFWLRIACRPRDEGQLRWADISAGKTGAKGSILTMEVCAGGRER